MTNLSRNVVAAFAAVLIVATSMAQVVTVPPAQASVIITPAIA